MRTMWFVGISVVLSAFFVAVMVMLARFAPEIKIGGGLIIIIGIGILGVAYAWSASIARRQAHKQRLAPRFVKRR